MELRLPDVTGKPHIRDTKALFLIPVAVVAYFSWQARNFQLDDALIYMRYIQNFLDGYGLTYNPGEKFNGLTSSLNSYLVLAASLVNENPQRNVIVLSAVFWAAACVVGALVFAKSTLEAVFTASVLGATGYFYATFGMETSLFLLLIALSLYLYKRDSQWFVITLALLLITRSEGVFLGAVIAVDYLWRHRRLPDLRFLFAALIIVAAPFVFNYFYYGAFLPATGGAKIGQGQSGLWGGGWIFLNVSYFLPAFMGGSALAAAFLVGLSMYGLLTEIRHRIVLISLAFWLLLAIFYVGLNIPNYHWYYAPFVYLALIAACRGLWQTLELAISKGPRLSIATVMSVVVAFGFAYSFRHTVSFAEGGPNQDYVAIGRWLSENTPDDSSVAMVEIGTVGWYSQREIVDILGLVNAFNADYLADRNWHGWLQHYQPDYILTHVPRWGHEQSVALMEETQMYRPVEDFPFQQYALLQRSEQVAPSEIAALARQHTREAESLRELEASSEKGAPFVTFQEGGLFAHAPMMLTLTVDEPASVLDVSFGVNGQAQGLHAGLCFSVRLETADDPLLSRCIETEATVDQMLIDESIAVSLATGDRLIFETECMASCDYGWTYWKKVLTR